MEIAKRYGAFGIKFTGDVTINGPMIDIHDNGRVYVHTKKMGSTVDQECDEEWEAVAAETGFVCMLQPDMLRVASARSWSMWNSSRISSCFCQVY